MKRGQVFVRALDPEGKWGNADVLDLTDESFRVFVVGRLMAFHQVSYVEDQLLVEPDIVLHTKVCFSGNGDPEPVKHADPRRPLGY